MKKKTQVLFSSFAAIAMSASVCAGATYALFTSETQVNVAVQAGTVEIVATVDKDTVATKSGVNWDVWNGTATTLTDGSVFSTFENGGGATFTDNSVSLQLMTPGDQVTFTIELDNKSNVNAMYRTVVLPTYDTGLLGGLEITFTDVTTAETEKLGSETFVGAAVADWAQLPENVSDVERKIQVTITLPEDAGNEYQGTEAKLVYYVEAVQGNADINNGNVVDADGYTLIQNATDLWRLSAQYANPYGVSVLSTTTAAPVKYRLANDIDLNGAPFMAIGTKANPFDCDFDGNGKTVSNFTVTNRSGAGLFGYVGKAGSNNTIESLTVKNAVINTNNSGAGIAGVVWGNVNSCTVENVEVTVTPYFDKATNEYIDGNKAGGIVAYLLNGTANNNIVKDVEVTAYRDLGGVLGMLSNDGSATPVEAKGNKATDVTVEFIEGYACVEEGKAKAQNNIAAIVGRTGGKVDVANNTAKNVSVPTVEVSAAEDLAEAFKQGGEVVIDKDLDVGANLIIPAGVTVTLDLTKGDLSTYAAGNNYIENYGTLVVNGGTIETTWLDNYGDMVLNNVTVKNTHTEALYAYPVCNLGGTLTINDCNIYSSVHGVVSAYSGVTNINGGTYTIDGKHPITSHIFYAANGATINVYDATVKKGADFNRDSGQIFYANSPSTINVYGGSYEWLVWGDFGPIYIQTNNVHLYGGSYKDYDRMSGREADYFNQSIAEGYSCVNTSNGWWSIAIEKPAVTDNVLEIGTAEELYAFAATVNNQAVVDDKIKNEVFTGVTVKLTADIDLGGAEWIPVGQTGAHGSFNGIFDGQNHTISNFYVNGMDKDSNYACGLFGWIEQHSDANHGAIKNVTVANATIIGNHNVAGIVGWTNAYVENCHVINTTISCVYSAVNGEDGNKAGAIVGYLDTGTQAKVSNCSAENVQINAGRDAGQLIGAAKTIGLGEGNTATNVTVVANGTGTGANVRNEFIGRVL
ncbi:MAG: hypothetical protein J6A63_08075 [Clostridia bacterium]|nr:hypothetical protein [Clostridia bacterium]